MYSELVRRRRHPWEYNGLISELTNSAADAIEELQKRVPKAPHGRWIDADALRSAMYHEAFETDSQMQKWDSGCWIRYKMFEKQIENAKTIIPAEESE